MFLKVKQDYNNFYNAQKIFRKNSGRALAEQSLELSHTHTHKKRKKQAIKENI